MYQATLDYLYAQLPMFTRIGAAAYKEDMHNTIALLEAIGNPHQHFKSIHIAGTNGKGSSSHMLAAIMHSADYKTGLYTSPHLYDFRERIKVSNGVALEMIPKTYVVDFIDRIKPTIEAIAPSFFEVTVALAFSWFADEKIDITIIETGLGGRLDSTNVITPELSIITNIGWDHMDLLGDTLAKIAAEKAGIIKPNTPVVVGEVSPETLPVFKAKAEACNTVLQIAPTLYTAKDIQPQIDVLKLVLTENSTNQTLEITCDLPGLYQQYNIITVFTAIRQLQQQGWNITDDHVLQALGQVKTITGLQGRWQLISRSPNVVLDVAHNEAGMQQVIHQINQLTKLNLCKNVHIVIGMVKDKDVHKVLILLPNHYKYYFSQAQMPRALPYLELQALAKNYGLGGEAFATPSLALVTAQTHASKDDLIVVCGSVFVVAEVEVATA